MYPSQLRRQETALPLLQRRGQEDEPPLHLLHQRGEPGEGLRAEAQDPDVLLSGVGGEAVSQTGLNDPVP